MSLWVGLLSCHQRCCLHTASSGVARYCGATSRADAEHEIRTALKDPRARRCRDCSRPIAIKHLVIYEDFF